MKKRICIDLRISQKSSRFTGIGIYAFNLSQTLEKIQSNYEFWYLVLKNYNLPWDLPSDRLIEVTRPKKPESLQEVFDFFDLKLKLKKNNIKLYHSLSPSIINPSKSIKIVNTLHDIIPEIFPEELSSSFAMYLYKLKMRQITKSTHIITDSNCTKNDFIERYNYKSKNISTVYLGSQFSKELIESNKKNKKRVWKRKFLLYNGGFNDRKNLINIIKSFAKVYKRIPNVDLLILGNIPLNKLSRLNKLINSFSNLKERIIFKGFIKSSNLPAYYIQSELFLFPSLYEGFGMPVLEAMQCSTPVITSNKGSIPELFNKSALIVNPYSTDQISVAIFNVLNNSNLRKSLSESGKKTSNLFTWEKCAIQTIKVYDKILKNYK